MKNIIIGLIIGVCLAVTSFHVWFLYKLSAQVNTTTQGLGQVVNFINAGIKTQQEATPAKK